MLITIKDSHTPDEIRAAIWAGFESTRFNVVEMDFLGPKRVKIRNIRLKERKRYCGNHPNACNVEGGRMGRYLEGLDWVEFNDRLNDIFDAHGWAAFIRSDRVVISRKGLKRRIRYTSHYLGSAFAWDYDDYSAYPDRTDLDGPQFEDWCGKIAPASEYPEGTPGTYERMVASVGL